MGRRRPQIWVIAEHKDETWSVRHGASELADGLADQDEAVDVVHRHRTAGEKVYSAEPDGYRTDRTREFAAADVLDRRQARESPPPRTVRRWSGPLPRGQSLHERHTASFLALSDRHQPKKPHA